MAQITWNQLQAPDNKAANALLLAGQEQFNTAIGQVGKVVTDYQAANTKNNTDAIMNALQSAKSPEEYQAALANAQAIAATKSGDFDQQKIYQTQMNQPAVLDAQQQQQYGIGDIDTMNQIAALRATGQFDQAAALLPNLKQSANIQGATQSIQDSIAAASKIKHDREAEQLATQQATETALQAKRGNDLKQRELDQKFASTSGYIGSDGNIVKGSLGSPTGSTTPAAPYADVGGATSGFTNQLIGGSAESNANLSDAQRAVQKNPGSSANGFGQFIDSTWLSTVKKIPAYSGMTDSQIMALKDNPDVQKQAIPVLAGDNANYLQKNGIPLTNSTMYSSWFLGNGVDQKALNVSAPATDKMSDYIPATPVTITRKDGTKVQTDARSQVLKANPQLKDMSVGDYRTWLDKKMGDSVASKASKEPAPYAFGLKTFAPIKTDYTQKMNDLNADIIKNQKYDANSNDPNISTHKAQLAQYLADNKLGLVGSALGLNSGSMQQLAIAKTVPGFNELSPRAQLGTLKELAAWNNSNGAFSKYTNMSADVLQQKIASIVSDSVKAYNGTADDRKQLMFNNAIANVRGKLLEDPNVGSEPTNQQIIDAMFGKAEGKNFKDTAATNTAASNITAAAPVATAPVVPAPVVPAKPNTIVPSTPNNTPLGIRALRGIGGAVGSVIDTTSVSNIASHLLGGGGSSNTDSVSRDAANRLRYGSMYPYMKATNDPRLKN